MSTAVALDTSPEAEASVVEMIKKHLSDPETQAQIKEQLQEEFARVVRPRFNLLSLCSEKPPYL